MYAFLNHRSSCFLDTVLVAMFSSTRDFDVCLGLESPETPFAQALANEIRRLRKSNDLDCGWVITRLRFLMGPPWDDGTPQSAVDFLHALLDKLKVEQLGWSKHMIAYVPRDMVGGPLPDVRVSEIEGFRMQLAVAGEHKTLSNVFDIVETVLPPEAESYSTVTFSILVEAPVLVFEVGRSVSTHRVEYGITTKNGRIFMDASEAEYTLTGVVCRIDEHYMGFVWVPESGWGMYDDTQNKGAIMCVSHPEKTNKQPSRFGELFFYVETHPSW
jgi:hypothetical protein